MAENKSSQILGTEYLQGRPVLHVQFSEHVPGLGGIIPAEAARKG
ncbi:hypothetical protein [Desulfosporosinus sp. OT]|nr:hypothetical protein [Desulfosporosinus sp. OT]EGW37047.1 hypothetical protein DOT_5041 [Desulfosporosinus sp. OT]